MLLRHVVTGEVFDTVKDVTGPLDPVASSMWAPVVDTPESSRAEDTKTEQGYVPPEDQMREMERSGLALQVMRRARYDSDLYPEGVLDEEIALDPFRDKSADVVDLVRQAVQTGARLREQDKKAKAAQAAAETAARAKAHEELVASLAGKTGPEIDRLLRQAKGE